MQKNYNRQIHVYFINELYGHFFNIQRDEKKDWRRREKILRETIDGVKVLLFILSSTTDDDVIRFR